MNHSTRTLVSMGRLTAMGLSVMASLWLAGCHTAPTQPNLALEDARSSFMEARSNPDIVKGAPLELERARAALSTAELAYSQRQDTQEVSHLAYLAKQQTQVAVNVGMQKAADEMVTAAGVERERLNAEAKSQQADMATRQAVTAVDRANDLEKQLAYLSAQQSSKGMVIVLQDMIFDSGKAELKPGAHSKLERIAEVLKAHPERKLMIEGYTDSKGGAEANRQLSERRAQAVAHALTSMGVNADRLQTHGNGEDAPVAGNDTASGRQQNRRVEIIFSDDKGAFGS